MLLLAVAGEAQFVTQVAAGYQHSLFLERGGSLWAMGNNANGQLGDGTLNQTNLPELIVATNVTAIAAGQFHSLFLKGDGSLWGMGNNSYGQLGGGNNIQTNLPEQITNGVTAVAVGQDHSLFIKNDGSLWDMGFNSSGQLGIGIYNNLPPFGTNQPQHVVTTNSVTAIAGGYQHSLLLKSDGSLWAMGNNSFGQLGNGTVNQTNRPVFVTNGVTAVAAGWYHSLFLKSDGSLWAMGDDNDGQLGDGTLTSNFFTNRPEMIVPGNVTAIAGGEYHTLFLKSDGSLWAMGYNGFGQLGDGTFNNTNRPEMIVSNNVVAIAAGQNHSLFVKRDGGLWGMGYNGFGQLGVGASIMQSASPVPIVVNPIAIQLLSSGGVRLTYAGLAGTNYALDRSFNLAPINWVPQATNPAGAAGNVVFTNTPNPATNNFWRIRSVP
jgi:alpha-tubulin suppressor-like RCC1 family protein